MDYKIKDGGMTSNFYKGTRKWAERMYAMGLSNCSAVEMSLISRHFHKLASQQ